MKNYLSVKIKLISLFLIILVLYIHSTSKNDNFYLNFIIKDFISTKIGIIAVPFFFVISGYLFFLNLNNGIYSVFTKIIKRYKSLFIPYIISCLLFVLTFSIFKLIPDASSHMDYNILNIYKSSFIVILKNIFWVHDDGNTPIAFHLWFLRDLIITVLLSPLIYFALKYLKWFIIFFLFIVISTNIHNFPNSLLNSIFWFSLGSIISLNNILTNLRFKYGFLIFFFYIFLSYLLESYMKYLNISLIILGIIGLWFTYDNIVSVNFKLINHKILSLLTEFTFFIYLIHLPSLNIIKKIIIIVLGKNQLGYLFSYLLTPLFFIIIIIPIGIFIKSNFPKLYTILVGGRV